MPLSNFLGWAVVSGTALGLFTLASRRVPARKDPWRGSCAPWAGGAVLYTGVLLFNLAVTASIREWRLLVAGGLLHSPGLGWLLILGYYGRSRKPEDRTPVEEEEHP